MSNFLRRQHFGKSCLYALRELKNIYCENVSMKVCTKLCFHFFSASFFFFQHLLREEPSSATSGSQHTGSCSQGSCAINQISPGGLLIENFFDCGENTEHEIHPLNKFLSVQLSVVHYKHNVGQQLSRKHFLFCLTEVLHLLYN